MEDEPHPEIFVPSLFDISTNDYFINKGMKRLTELGLHIEKSISGGNFQQSKITELRKERKQLSKQLQQELFNQYDFINDRGEVKNVCDIFDDFYGKKPPSGAGECAAPKLLQYAFEKKMQPIAIAEFWWGISPTSKHRKHLEFYPSCEEKCRPILTFMITM